MALESGGVGVFSCGRYVVYFNGPIGGGCGEFGGVVVHLSVVNHIIVLSIDCNATGNVRGCSCGMWECGHGKICRGGKNNGQCLSVCMIRVALVLFLFIR